MGKNSQHRFKCVYVCVIFRFFESETKPLSLSIIYTGPNQLWALAHNSVFNCHYNPVRRHIPIAQVSFWHHTSHTLLLLHCPPFFPLPSPMKCFHIDNKLLSLFFCGSLEDILVHQYQKPLLQRIATNAENVRGNCYPTKPKPNTSLIQLPCITPTSSKWRGYITERKFKWSQQSNHWI